MVKKTAKSAKTASQRAREEQWRRRAAAQGGLPASTGTVERDDSDTDDDGAEATYAPRSGAAKSTASTYAARSASAARSRTSFFDGRCLATQAVSGCTTWSHAPGS